MRVTVETERLILRPLVPEDYDLGFALKETGELIGSGGLVYNREGDDYDHAIF